MVFSSPPFPLLFAVYRLSVGHQDFITLSPVLLLDVSTEKWTSVFFQDFSIFSSSPLLLFSFFFSCSILDLNKENLCFEAVPPVFVYSGKGMTPVSLSFYKWERELGGFFQV